MSGRAVRVDAHQHFWSLVRGDYRWLTPALAPLYRDFDPQDLEPLAAQRGIDCTVVVQAADTPAETQHLLALADRTPFVAGVVGWTDFGAAEVAHDIGELASHPKLVGVRPMIQDLPDPRWMLKPELAPAFAALREHDLCFDALVRPVHLRHLIALLEREPELAVIIDHGAKPQIAEGGSAWSGFAAWREALCTIARESRAWCKLSGLVTEALTTWQVDDLRPFVDVLLEAFGPSRLVWGSDWPVVNLAGGYARWCAATDALLERISPADRERVLGTNALDFYGLARPADLAAPRRSNPPR